MIPTNPQDRARTNAEVREWRENIEKQLKREKKEDRRFWITVAVSSVAALAAVAGIVIQLVLAK